MTKEREIAYADFLLEPKRKYILGYSQHENVVLQYREDDQKYSMTIKEYPWYFYIRRKDAATKLELLDNLVKSHRIKRITKAGDFIKIWCRNANKKVMDEKHEIINALTENGIQTYEADLSSHLRCLIDNNLEIEDTYKYLSFDIETDDRNRGIVIGRDQIISFAAVNQDNKIFYYSSKDEKKLLKKFLDLIEDYDILIGWNSEKFDIPYLRERIMYHDIWYNWKQIIQVDLMKKLMEMHRKNTELIREVRSFALGAVATHFLGEQKKERNVERKDKTSRMGIWDLFVNHPDLLKEYNIQDAVLVKKLDDKLKLLKQKIVEHRITGCFLDEYAVSRVLDIYTLRKNKELKMPPIRSRPTREEIDPNEEESFAGGLVLEPVRGIHHNVHHFDFTSLYPSIIQTFNISPDTFLDKRTNNLENAIKTPNDQYFSRYKGIVPTIITDLLSARNDIRHHELKRFKEGTPEYEDLYYKQYAFKTLANSFYGILGAPFTRYYKIEMAEAITLSGHYLIKLMRDWFTAAGKKVLYGDTDSVFVILDHQENLDNLYEKVNAFIEYHLYKNFAVEDCHINLKIESNYKNFLLVDKKRYVKNEDGKLKIVGLEAKRRETLGIAVKAQLELLEMIMNQNKKMLEIVDWLNNLKEKVLHNMKIEELTIQLRLSKDVNEYDKTIRDDFGDVTEVKASKLAHVQVAKWLKENSIQENGLNTWEKGCYIKYVVIEHKPKIRAISIYQFDNSYDSTYYWNVKVYAILQRILAVVFPDHDWEQYLIPEPKTIRKRKVLSL